MSPATDWLVHNRKYLHKMYLSPSYVGNEYRKTSNIKHILLGNKIVDHSDIVGASPVGAAPTTSLFSSWRLSSVDWADNCKTRRETYKFRALVRLILEIRSLTLIPDSPVAPFKTLT